MSIVIVKGYEDYTIHIDGTVTKKSTGLNIKPYDNGLGYIAIKLRKNGKRFQLYLHRLIAENFIGECKGLDINHKDGNKKNNKIENLEIITHKENMKHAFENKLLKGFISKRYIAG